MLYVELGTSGIFVLVGLLGYAVCSMKYPNSRIWINGDWMQYQNPFLGILAAGISILVIPAVLEDISLPLRIMFVCLGLTPIAILANSLRGRSSSER